MSQARVVPLDATQSIDRTAVGPKAMSLVRMNQIGLPVPPGFCVLGAAFREHLEANGLITRIESAVDELGMASPEARKSLLSGLRQAIIETPLAQHLRNEIENHYRTLGADRFAVRSSATVEDLPGHSFAGQYETYLGVTDVDGCMNAIKKCWASLWTERAYEYRQKNGFDHMTVNMAVIVQKLIGAEVSGVIFTADPVNGYKSRMIIEAVPGLGDSLVSGKVTPDRFMIRKPNLKIISRRTQNGKLEFFFDKTATDSTWEYLITAPPAGLGATSDEGVLARGTLTFGGDGILESMTMENYQGGGWTAGTPNANGYLAFQTPFSGATSIELDLGINYPAGSWQPTAQASTQFGSGSYNIFSTADGYGEGDFTNFSITSEGIIRASFNNGVTSDLFRVGLANSNDPASHFQRIGYSLYQADPESAALITSDTPGNAGLGKIMGSSLESSNVDMAEQFGDLIFTQRAFQANSKSMVAADEMLKTLIALKR